MRASKKDNKAGKNLTSHRKASPPKSAASSRHSSPPPMPENIVFGYQNGDKRVVLGKPLAGVIIAIAVCASGASAHSIQLLAQILATPLRKWLGF